MDKSQHNVQQRIKLSFLKPSQTIVILVSAAVIGLFVVGGFALSAPTKPLLYITPSEGSYSVGDDLAIAVRENSYGATANAVQVGLTYNASLLQYTAIDATDSAFSTNLTPSTQSAGKVIITRFTTGARDTGDQLAATVHFKALAAGTVSVGYTSQCSASNNPAADCTGLSSNGSNIAISTSGGSYAIQNSSMPTSSSTAKNGSSTGLTGGLPTASAIVPAFGSGNMVANNSVSSNNTVSGTIVVEPVTTKLIGASKTQLRVDGRVLSTSTQKPNFYLSLYTSGIPNGQHTITVTTIDNNNKTTTIDTQTVMVFNQRRGIGGWLKTAEVNVAWGLHGSNRPYYMLVTIGTLVVIAGGIILFVRYMPRKEQNKT